MIKGKKCVFTICANNYFGLAYTLEESFRKYHSDIDFITVIVDVEKHFELKNNFTNTISALEITSNYFTEDIFKEMAFKYNLTEFCTSIKATCFRYFFDFGKYDEVIYLDPDVYVFSNFDYIFKQLDTHLILLTPHILTITTEFKGERSERGILSTGVFNLGFLALKNNKKIDQFLCWWEERLKVNCFNDILDSTFTDQKWFDLVPCFFNSTELKVSDNLGLNVAPWNYFEREIEPSEKGFLVKLRSGVFQNSIENDKLVFVHFSGFNYPKLVNGEIDQNNIQGLEVYSDQIKLCTEYASHLQRNIELFNRFIGIKYAFNTFENGADIKLYFRRLYRSLLEEGLKFGNPFSVEQGSFYELIKQKGILKDEFNQVKFDNLNKHNLVGVSNKLKKINFLMKLIFKLLGPQKYFLLVRFFRPYSRIENHIFLINNELNPKL